MSSAALRQEIARGFYPERAQVEESPLDRALGGAVGRLGTLRASWPGRYNAIVRAVEKAGARLGDLSDEELAWQAKALRPELKARGFELELVARAFALIREASGRRLKMRHFDVQLIGGWALLQGMVAEMRTGEGKTVTATLPACTAALAGIPVHVITVNDYLAQRDASWMAPLYRALGLRVGCIIQPMGFEERRDAYRCDITYCTNKEVVFDYLRDRLELGRRPGPIQARLERTYGKERRLDRLRLRGLCFAIVDEADSVLIDEARTPLIISGPGDSSYEAAVYRQALDLSHELVPDLHYTVNFPRRLVELTPAGRDRLEELGHVRGGVWTGQVRREEMVRQALTARHLFHRDRHYVIKEGKIQIVDEYTGRTMPGRSWEGGLHQLIETKEDCEVTTQTEVLGRISYQRFFRRYLTLSGMTGTAREASKELWSVYRLQVVTIPTHKPMRRRELPTRVFQTAELKWSAVVARLAELHAMGRPVLVGTRTVADSRHLAGLLENAGIPCRVLNALQDAMEAEIVSQAGRLGQITVATNMAGRGTDILLSPQVHDLGGLHVLATELHDARRIDRQLFGRCARQGDPGSCEAFVSLEDDLLRGRKSDGSLRPAQRWLQAMTPGPFRARVLFRAAQRAAERRHYLMRRDLLKLDETVETALAFAGRGE
ncbi:MAG TPA: preprotein translocase subunit SecA [Candidatus Polarisedimenticolia bacterium]|nr:preprotein translocase subunit SecA [Candidatus Polarisedimenticolia bacterium]